MAWFLRGAQSAVFYYVSCAPCANYAFERRRAKQKARADKETKQLMRHVSRHPNGQFFIPDGCEGATQEMITGMGAFTTNIYWREDEMMGPRPKRGRNRGNTIETLDTGDGKENKKGKGRGNTAADVNRKRSATTGSMESAGQSSMDTTRRGASREGELDRKAAALHSTESKESGPRVRYQRPDEMLWGEPIVEEDWEYFARGRNPEVNNLCPPVVSTKPATSSQARWMLQPPPAAKIMDGKQAPLTRRPSANVDTRATSRKRRGRANDVGEAIHKPAKAHICELGERMSDLHERKRRSWFRGGDGATDDDDDDDDNTSPTSRPRTPPEQIRSGNAESLSTDWTSPSRSAEREKRFPPPIVTSQRSTPSKPAPARDGLGFDPSWTFPRKPELERSPLSEMASSRIPRIDGYYSEPEPAYPYTTGVSRQDFATSPMSTFDTPTILEAPAPPQSSHRTPSSRPQSDSTVSESRSTGSSTSSFHPLDVLTIPDGNLPLSDTSNGAKSPQSPGFDGKEPVIDGSGDSGHDVGYWTAAREFRLADGESR